MMIQPITSDAHNPVAGKVTLITWEGLTVADGNGAPVSGASNADRSIQFFGTWGAGGTVQFQGSNDGIHWAAITDPQGNAITKTTDSLEACTEVTQFVRPVITGGDGTTSVTAILLTRGK